jgi:DNA-binding FadR family transcriptional regulator
MSEDIIKPRRLYQEVEARLESDMREGRLRPGDPMPSERALMQRFGVGRPAIREALFALSKKGLVYLSAGRRARVASPTPEALAEQVAGVFAHLAVQPEGLDQLHKARVVLESALAREAARRSGTPAVRRIRDALRSNFDAAADKDAFEKSDGDFHTAIGQASDNPILATLHAALVGCLAVQRHAVMRYPNVEETSLALHEDVCRSIESGNAERAERAVRASLDRVDHMYRTLDEATRADTDALARA